MMTRDDSHGPDEIPASAETEAEPATGASTVAEPAVADAGPPEPSVSPAAPAPVSLWRGERSVVKRVAAGAEHDRIAAALDAIAGAIPAAEAGAEPLVGTGPPATLADLVAAATALAEPMATAFAGAGDEPSDARASLGRAVSGWVLAVLACRLGTAARECGRSLVPLELTAGLDDFASRHIASAKAGHGTDADFLAQSLPGVRAIADAAWELLSGTDDAVEAVPATLRPALGQLLGQAILRLIRLEHWHYESCLEEPDAGGLVGWSNALRSALGFTAWRSPDGVPPRPVIDDITDRAAQNSGAADATDHSAAAGDAA